MYFKNDKTYKPALALLDSGAAVSLINKAFVMKWGLPSINGTKIKLIGFNNTHCYAEKYVLLNIFDDSFRMMAQGKFLIFDKLAMDLLIGFDLLQNFKIITEENYMVLENNDVWVFRRNKPKTKIVFENSIIPPGHTVLNIRIPKSCNPNSIFKIRHECLSESSCPIFRISSDRKMISVPVMNTSNKIINTKEEKICDLDEVNEKILKLHEPIPPHHRRHKKLSKLNLEQINYNKAISKKDLEQLKKLLTKYHYCFSRDSSDIGIYSGGISYDIILLNDIKETFKPKNFKGHEREFIRKELQKLLKNDIICRFPTARTYCGLTLALKKSPEGQKLRLCLNSQIINVNTRISQNFQMPDLSNQIEKLSNRKFYCRFDLSNAYWQVRIPKQQIGLYTFEFENVTYSWLRSSFGTKGMSSAFSCIMASVFGSIPNCVIYIDDITIYNNSIKEQLKTIAKILEKCSEYGLTFNLQKCSFFDNQINAFGYIIDINGNRPDVKRMEQLLNLEFPKTLKKLQSALGSLNYYNRCLPEFKRHAACFYDLTSNFKYNPLLKKKWKMLLSCVSKAILRNRPDYNQTLYISTDSSDIAGGCTFFQKDGDNIKLIQVDSLRHYGRWLLAKPSHKEFSILYSILKKHRRFITLFPKIHIICDNAVMYALLKNINSVRILTKSVPVRWLSYVSLFNFDVSHSKGENIEFILTDLLSRSKKPIHKNGFFTIGDLRKEELMVWKTDFTDEYAVYSLPFSEYLKPLDSEYLRNKIKESQFKLGYDDSRENVRIAREKVEIDGKFKQTDVLYLRDKLIVPPDFLENLLMITHNHQSPQVWYQNLKKLNIETKHLHKRLFNYWKACVVCQSQHPKKDIYRRSSISVSDDVGEIGHVDVLHINGQKFLNLVDHFSGFLWSEFVENETEKVLSETLMKMIFSSGIVFGTIVTDNHASFRGEMLLDFTSSLNIHLVHTSSRNPRGNSKIESLQRQIVKQIKLLQNEKIPLWLTLQMSVFILNNSENKTQQVTAPPSYN